MKLRSTRFCPHRLFCLRNTVCGLGRLLVFLVTVVIFMLAGLFVEAFKREAGGVWIMKPIGKAQGKGIFLFTKLSDIKDWKKDHTWKSDAPQVTELASRGFRVTLFVLVRFGRVYVDLQAEAYVVQKYIENPYTIGGTRPVPIRLLAYYHIFEVV